MSIIIYDKCCYLFACKLTKLYAYSLYFPSLFIVSLSQFRERKGVGDRFTLSTDQLGILRFETF